METVKSVFGVALLAAAGIFLKDAFPQVKPLFSAAREAAFVAAGLAALGVLAGALHASFHGPALAARREGAGMALLVGGIVYAVGAAGARERARSAAAFAWLHSEEEAIALAKAEGRPVIIDFWAEWCTACKELDKIAWADPRVREEAGRFVAVKLDGTDGSDAFQALSEKYGIVGMPTVIFIDPRGREVPGARDRRDRGGRDDLEKLRAVDRRLRGRPAAASRAGGRARLRRPLVARRGRRGRPPQRPRSYARATGSGSPRAPGTAGRPCRRAAGRRPRRRGSRARRGRRP